MHRRGRNYEEIRATGDILQRASRPQRHSSFLPTRRDWRYETGVFKHEDSENPGEMSVWDELDYDALIGVFGRERRRKVTGDVLAQDGKRMISRTRTIGSASEVAEFVSMDSTVNSEETSRKVVTARSRGKKLGTLRKTDRSRPNTVTSYMQVTDTKEEESMWECIGLVVCLQHDPNHTSTMDTRSGLVRSPHTPKPSSPTETPTSLSTASSSKISQPSLKSIEPTPTFPLFDRQWVDETEAFSMKKVIETLRAPDKNMAPPPETSHWFREAVPVDALFPPGVPLSAKEINAYYPHHARWQGVALRLVNNGYRGADIVGMQAWFRSVTQPPVTPSLMNMFLRDDLRSVVPSFRTGEGQFIGKPDCNLSTHHLNPGPLVKARHGFTVPTFEDLLKGLKYLPTGLDARGLTQCLTWYLNFRDLFSPRLDLNVLHTQSLIRALRQPLKTYEQQNLDKNGLKEWRENGAFVQRAVKDEERRYECTTQKAMASHKSTLVVNPKDESVKLHLKLQTRHVLMLPCVAMLGMAGKALEMGIQKAARQRKSANHFEGTAESESGVAFPEQEKESSKKEQHSYHYRITKRPCEDDGLLSRRASKKVMSVSTRAKLLKSKQYPGMLMAPNLMNPDSTLSDTDSLDTSPISS